MERVNQIFSHPVYQKWLHTIKEYEQQRVFCKHNEEHFLAVARIAWIMCLEADVQIDRELVYAAALLHDIGKSLQYSEGIGHEKASAGIAKELLRELGFSAEEIRCVVGAILQHRKPDAKASQFENIFYKADKASRMCFCCPARAQCNWEPDQKNIGIII